jgi:hypothetical protein
MLSSALLFAVAFAQAPKYGKCNKDNFERKDLINVNIPIQKVLTQSPIEVSGSIYIIDGCSFGVRDFKFLNADASYWVGGYKGSAEAMTLVTENVTPSAFNTNQTYNLRQDAGAEANFDGFNQFRLFVRNTNLLIATADFPAKGETPTATTKPGSGSSTTASGTKSTATTTTKSSADAISASIYTLFGGLIAAFLM